MDGGEGGGVGGGVWVVWVGVWEGKSSPIIFLTLHIYSFSIIVYFLEGLV